MTGPPETRSFPYATRVDEVAALPSPAVLLSARLRQYCGRLRLPPDWPPTSRLFTGYRAPHSDTTPQVSGRGGSPLFPLSPSTRSVARPLRREILRGCASRLFTPSVAFALRDGARLLLVPANMAGTITNAADFALCCGPCVRSPSMGFRHRASTRTVSRPSRRSATGPPGSYPDRTCTGWRQRACLQMVRSSLHRPSTSRRTPRKWRHRSFAPSLSIVLAGSLQQHLLTRCELWCGRREQGDHRHVASADGPLVVLL